MKPARQETMITHKYSYIYATGRPRCPVCSKDVYSAAGIHPQCALKQNIDRQNAEAKAALEAVAASEG